MEFPSSDLLQWRRFQREKKKRMTIEEALKKIKDLESFIKRGELQEVTNREYTYHSETVYINDVFAFTSYNSNKGKLHNPILLLTVAKGTWRDQNGVIVGGELFFTPNEEEDLEQAEVITFH